jgi:hypothetical protein
MVCTRYHRKCLITGPESQNRDYDKYDRVRQSALSGTCTVSADTPHPYLRVISHAA